MNSDKLECSVEKNAAQGLLPNLVIAGAPKSGTSSLFRWLADHPEVLGSSVKETYYFVDPGTHMHNAKCHYATRGLDGYRDFFPAERVSPKLVLEATPSYLYSETALRELPRLPSAPHFIFLLREPVEQIHSAFRYFQGNWGWISPEMRFEGFVETCATGGHDFGGNELARNALRNAAYANFLLRWREVCGDDRIHIFLFEKVFADKRGFMQRLAATFGIDPGFYDAYDFPIENQTYGVRSRALQKVNLAVRGLLPQGALYRAARTFYRKLNTEAGGIRLDPAFARQLAKKYEVANEQLAREFTLNLEPWAAIARARDTQVADAGDIVHGLD